MTVEVENVYAQASRLHGELETERAIVDRVWRALGITSYEQAGGKAIDEIVDNMRHALRNIATQKTMGECSEDGEDCEGDFEGAYDILIGIARRALPPTT